MDAYLEHKFKGIVTEIATSANITGVSADQVTNFEVKILILEDSYQDLVDEADLIKSPSVLECRLQLRSRLRQQMILLQSRFKLLPQELIRQINEIITEEYVENEDEEKDLIHEDEEMIECVFLYEDGKAILQVVEPHQDNMYIQITEGVEVDQGSDCWTVQGNF